MDYDFKTLNTGGGVHPFAAMNGATDPSIITFSVAEMRLNIAPEITRGMHRIVDIGSFGYFPPEKERYDAAVCGWMKRRHSWEIQPEWAVQTAGVVTAMGIAVRALTEPGDGVIIQTPVYMHFYDEVKTNGRALIENPLIEKDGVWTMDFEDLEKKAADPNAKMLMLCSPHNPIGRVWTREELQRVGEICLKHNLYVFCDEIHFDLILSGEHTVLTEAVPALKDRVIIGTAPSKTFNLAGNALSNIIIPNEALRRRFEEDAGRYCGHYTGTFAFASTTAAYEEGDAWLEALLAHLRSNRALLEARLKALIPGVVLSPLEGTYLQWIDLRCLGLEPEQLMKKLEEAQIFVNNGTDFGTAGAGWVRFNLACPASAIEAAMDRLAAVL